MGKGTEALRRAKGSEGSVSTVRRAIREGTARDN